MRPVPPFVQAIVSWDTMAKSDGWLRFVQVVIVFDHDQREEEAHAEALKQEIITAIGLTSRTQIHSTAFCLILTVIEYIYISALVQ